MLFRVKFLAIVLFVVLLFAGCGQVGFQTVPSKIEDFVGNTVEGDVSSYSKEKGAATLIVVSASWCGACNSELPALKKLAAEYEGLGLKVLVVNEDDDIETAAKYKRARDIEWTMLHWNYEMMNKLGNPGVIPVHYLVDSQDSVQRVDVGAIDASKMRHELDRLLKRPNT
ncbi:MAG: TlpA family protein disulfide reductase [Fibrobacter sp.]|nr:TlpA family protein disulfide reductase [Fibrobacter sp.]